MNGFLAALGFLTILPALPLTAGERKSLSSALVYFPIVGLILGVLLASLDSLILSFLPIWPASALTVAMMVAVSGGLHMDGLSDTADGLLSSAPRERILEIMKDSRAGPMGVMAVVLVILFKTTALASTTGGLRWDVVMLAPLAGRCAMVVAVTMFGYARREGLGSVFNEKKIPFNAVLAILFLAVAGLIAAEGAGVMICSVSLVSALALGAYAARKIGGLTGDVYGAVCEIAEAAALLAAAAWIGGGAV